MNSLPCELTTCVLSRLSVKDLLRFRCVSKSWHALIDDPFFVQKHLQRCIDESEISDNPPLLFSCNDDKYKVDTFVGMEKCKVVKMEFTSVVCSSIIGACNGLLCVSRQSSIHHHKFFSVWNLSTRESHDLLADPRNRHRHIATSYYYGFGHDRLSDDYKLIQIIRSTNCAILGTNITVYSLKTKSWTPISSQDSPPDNELDIRAGNGTFARSTNAIYWVFRWNRKIHSPFLIGGFDLGDGNRYLEVEQPDYNKEEGDIIYLVIGALRGCLCLYSCYSSLTSHHIWVMKAEEDHKMSSWTKLISFSNDLFFEGWIQTKIPLVYSRSGNKILLDDYQYSGGLMWYDLNTETCTSVERLGWSHGCCFLKTVMTESLVRIGNGTTHS